MVRGNEPTCLYPELIAWMGSEVLWMFHLEMTAAEIHGAWHSSITVFLPCSIRVIINKRALYYNYEPIHVVGSDAKPVVYSTHHRRIVRFADSFPISCLKSHRRQPYFLPHSLLLR